MNGAVEGRRAVAEALSAGLPVVKLLVAQGTREERGLEELLRLAELLGVPVERRPRRELDALSERAAHQGVIALTRPFEYASMADILSAAEGEDRALVLALDHVTDAGNLGAVARSAEAAGARGLVIEKRRSASVGPGAFKASAGALAHLPVACVTNLTRTLETLKDAGFWVVGATERAEASLWDAPIDGRIVLVMGAEGSGLSRLVRESCDILVSVPMSGAVGSLNVAQAATLLAYEWVRRGRGA